MSLLFFEGFENKEPAGRYGVTYTQVPTFVAGRSSGSAIRATGTSACVMAVSMPPTVGVLVASAAVRLDALTGSALFALMALYNSQNNIHTRLDILATTGQLQIVPSSGANVTSQYALVVGEWARIDFVASVANAGGWAQVWVNGVMVVEMASGDTLSGVDAVTTSVRFSVGPNNNTRVTLDDVYVVDEAGAAPYNGRMGDVRIENLVPTGNGSASQLAGSDGNSVDNWALVDEFPYVAGDHVVGSAGQRDLYTFADLSIPAGVVHAVQHHMVVSKTDSGAASLIPVTKVGAAEFEDAAVGLGLTPVYAASSIRTVAPDGTPWSVAKVNAAEFGVEVG